MIRTTPGLTPLPLLLLLGACDKEGCPEGTHTLNGACVDDEDPIVTYPDSAPDDSATDDSADDSATDDSATDDSATDDSATDDSAAPDCDLDGDGFESLACGGADCDDGDARVHPAAPDLWDRVDNNCDGLTDRATLTELSAAATSGSAVDDRITSIDNLCGGQDLTGDGVPDIAVGAPVRDAWDGGVFLLSGADLGAWTGDIHQDALLAVDGGGTTDNLGFLPDHFGDLDGDGVADLLVGARAAPGGGAAYVFFGGASLRGTRSSSTADLVLTGGTGGVQAGFAAEGASDLNGDGRVELALGDPQAGGGRVALFSALPSGATASADDADATLLGGTGERLGETLGGGDLDGDGYAELLVGVPGSGGGDGGLVVVPGGATLPGGDASAAQRLRVLGSGGAQLGGNSRGVARPADVDGSGQPDLVVSMYQGAGTVLIFADPSSGTLRPEDAAVRYVDAPSYLGSSVVTGDLDQDGTPDVLVGAYVDSAVYSSGGSVSLLWGGSHLSGGLALSRDGADALLDATAVDQLLGTAVGFTGDLTGDGVPDWLAGASWDAARATQGGTLHVIAGVP